MQITPPEKGQKKMGRPPKLEKDLMKDRDPLRCDDATFESWMRAMGDMRYKKKSDFYRDMINTGIMINQGTKSKNSLNNVYPHASNRDIIRDIIECLIYDPSEYGFPEGGSTGNLAILRVEHLAALLPDYSPKKIEKTLGFNQDIFEYLPPYNGWRLLDAFPKKQRQEEHQRSS